MNAKLLFWIPVVLALSVASADCQGTPSPGNDPLLEKARSMARNMIIIDAHIDLPYRLSEHDIDLAGRDEGGDFDYPRAKAGELKAAFMAVYVPASYEEKGGAKALADRLIDLMKNAAGNVPDKFAIV